MALVLAVKEGHQDEVAVMPRPVAARLARHCGPTGGAAGCALNVTAICEACACEPCRILHPARLHNDRERLEKARLD